MLEEGLERIGTIAKSDTHKFFQLLTGDQKKDTNLIGQFIVGFYSSFVVTDKAMLTTGRAGMTAENGAYEESDGHSSYTLENVELPRRGTEVTLHLPEGEDELLNGSRLRSIIQTYSYHITIPILTQSEDEEKKDEEDRVNQALTLWDRSKSENSVEGHNEFYKHITHDFEVPLAHGHSCVEGNYEYTLLLYISTRVTFGLWSLEWHHGVKLYVRRVFVMDDAEKLMPNYLAFCVVSLTLAVRLHLLVWLLVSTTSTLTCNVCSSPSVKQPRTRSRFWRSNRHTLLVLKLNEVQYGQPFND